MEGHETEKKDRLLAALDQGMVMVHVDARRPGVLVPTHLRPEAHLRLNLSYRFDPPDLSVGEWGVRSTLTFNGTRFTVALPWSALFAITSHVSREFWLYPDDMPPELVEQTQVTQKASLESLPRPKTKLQCVQDTPAASLSVAPSEAVPEEQQQNASQDPPEPPEPPKPRSHLRLVKS
jgi:stringent starvation protein B